MSQKLHVCFETSRLCRVFRHWKIFEVLRDCYRLYNLKNVKNTHWGVSLLEALLLGCFSRFFNCTDGTKSRSISYFLIFLFYFLTLIRYRANFSVIVCFIFGKLLIEIFKFWHLMGHVVMVQGQSVGYIFFLV